MSDELYEIRTLRLKLKAAKSLIRDLDVAAARAEEALSRNAQPRTKEAQRGKQNHKIVTEVGWRPVVTL